MLHTVHEYLPNDKLDKSQSHTSTYITYHQTHILASHKKVRQLLSAKSISRVCNHAENTIWCFVGVTQLQQARVNQGVEKIRETRLQQFDMEAHPLEECPPLIQDLVSKGEVVVKMRAWPQFTGKHTILKLLHYYIESQ